MIQPRKKLKVSMWEGHRLNLPPLWVFGFRGNRFLRAYIVDEARGKKKGKNNNNNNNNNKQQLHALLLHGCGSRPESRP